MTNPGRQPSPFLYYLSRQQGFPSPASMPFPHPLFEWRIFQLSGFTGHNYTFQWEPDHPRRSSPEVLNGWPDAYSRWQTYARVWRPLRDFVEGDRCWRPPDRWPSLVEARTPPHVTPGMFAIGLFPMPGRRPSVLYRAEPSTMYGLGALSAYSLGWPVSHTDHAIMAAASEWLQTQIPFFLWAYNPNLTTLRLPEKTSRWRHLQARRRLETDPLGVGLLDIPQGLPPGYRSVDDLMSLPRRPFDPFRTTRPLLLAAEHHLLHGDRRRDWIRFDWDA